MGFASGWHWILVLLVVLLVFGAGKLPRVGNDLAKAIRGFKAGLKDDDEEITTTVVTPTTTRTTTTTIPPENHRPV